MSSSSWLFPEDTIVSKRDDRKWERTRKNEIEREQERTRNKGAEGESSLSVSSKFCSFIHTTSTLTRGGEKHVWRSDIEWTPTLWVWGKGEERKKEQEQEPPRGEQNHYRPSIPLRCPFEPCSTPSIHSTSIHLAGELNADPTFCLLMTLCQYSHMRNNDIEVSTKRSWAKDWLTCIEIDFELVRKQATTKRRQH